MSYLRVIAPSIRAIRRCALYKTMRLSIWHIEMTIVSKSSDLSNSRHRAQGD